MHLVCPKCATSYQLGAGAVGTGRSVRCARCKNVWFAAPEPQSTAADAAREEAAFRDELGADSQATSPATTKSSGETVPATTASIASADAPLGTPSAAAEAELPQGASYLRTPAVESTPIAPGTENAASPITTISNEPEDVESVAARRMPASKPPARRRTAPRSKLPLIILVLLAGCAAIIGWRKDIVRQAPQLASLYRLLGMPVNVRGLVFTDVKTASETHDGVPVLTVEGMIVSAVREVVEVPRLRFALRNGAGEEIFSWTAMPTQTALAPGETLPFRSRVASPPGEVQDVQVRFFNRGDTAAGGH